DGRLSADAASAHSLAELVARVLGHGLHEDSVLEDAVLAHDAHSAPVKACADAVGAEGEAFHPNGGVAALEYFHRCVRHVSVREHHQRRPVTAGLAAVA